MFANPYHQEFLLYVPEPIFKKGDIVQGPNNQKFLVSKVYQNTWWRRLMRDAGYKTKAFHIKFKPIIYEHRRSIKTNAAG